MDWSSRRKIIYASATAVFLIAFFFYEFRTVLFPDPTCFDQKKNGYESGVDCGGTCSLQCSNEVSPVTVEWAHAIKTGPNTYDFVGMLSNKNINSAPIATPYIFIAVDKTGKVINTQVGSTTVLVSGSFPVLYEGVTLAKEPANLILRTTQTPFYRAPDTSLNPPIKTGNFRYDPGSISRITVLVTNTTRTVYLKLPIRIVAYDENDNVIAAGESILPMLDKEESKDVVFTWHYVLPVVPTKFRAYAIINPFGQ